MGPCKNPSCKSYGRPHPNCKCYASFAKGGEVSFCAEDRLHDPSCEYSEPIDHHHQVSGYFAHHGINGLLNGRLESDPERYHSAIAKGHKRIDDHASSLFSSKSIEIPDTSSRLKELDEWLKKGGVTDDIQNQIYDQHEDKETTPEHFAKGGKVESNDDNKVSTLYPSQNLLLNETKGRMSQYLASQKPQEYTPKLAFDPEPDQREQEKSYHKAKEIAVHPLSILHKIQQGTIEPIHVKHFSQMYPDLNDSLQKKLTEKITEAQLKGEKPSYTTRQGLSMLLGTPLSSEMTPASIQAAQAVFQQQSQPQPSAPAKGKSKKGTSSLSKSDQSFLTSNQALVSRSQKQ